jgi:hypothetical protein
MSMAKLKLTLSDVAKKHLKILAYLLISGVLGWVLAGLASKPELVAVFAPAVNYALFALEKELRGQGYVEALREK